MNQIENNKSEMIPNFLRISFLALLFVSQAAFAQTVYVTKTGEKYHKGSCQHLSKSKIEMDLEKANKLGFKPCAVCQPLKKATNVQPLTQTPSTLPSTSQQCSAYTKESKRCSRTTTNASGKCWQHE